MRLVVTVCLTSPTWLAAKSVVAALLDPPPSPACTGVRFSRYTLKKQSALPVLRRNKSSARRTRLLWSVCRAVKEEANSSAAAPGPSFCGRLNVVLSQVAMTNWLVG